MHTRVHIPSHNYPLPPSRPPARMLYRERDITVHNHLGAGIRAAGGERDDIYERKTAARRSPPAAAARTQVRGQPTRTR